MLFLWFCLICTFTLIKKFLSTFTLLKKKKKKTTFSVLSCLQQYNFRIGFLYQFVSKITFVQCFFNIYYEL